MLKDHPRLPEMCTEPALAGHTSKLCGRSRSEAEGCLDNMAEEDCATASRPRILQARGVLQLHLALLYHAGADNWSLQQLQMQIVDLGWWWRVSQPI